MSEKKLFMELTFQATLMNGDSLSDYLKGEKGRVKVGSFEVRVPGYLEKIPFGFEAGECLENEDGSYTYSNFDGILKKAFDLYPCDLRWAENGLTQEDITADLLSSADKIEDFYFEIMMYGINVPYLLEIKDMVFIDEYDKEYRVSADVLDTFNKMCVAERFVPLTCYYSTHQERRTLIEEMTGVLKDTNPARLIEKISALQGGKNKQYSDFLIDCMLHVANSGDKVFRVGLAAYGNIDHGEGPYEVLPGTAPKYAYKDSIEGCQKEVSRYIRANDLGSGNWCGGLVYQGSEYVGNISYNGRFWDAESEYGNPKRLAKTDLPKIDADICSYGKNPFMSGIGEKENSLDRKIEASKDKSVKKSAVEKKKRGKRRDKVQGRCEHEDFL